MDFPGTRPRRLIVVFLAVTVVVSAISGIAMYDESPAEVDGSTRATHSTATDVVEPLHSAGITGSDVRVGVVDSSGFALESERSRAAVVAHEQFGTVAGTSGRHGKRAVETVTRLASDSRLYLASFSQPPDFERAVEWLLRQEIDVLLVPTAFYGRPGDGSSRVAEILTAAEQSGVAVVTAAGNTRARHWAGRFEPTRSGEHRFGNDTENYLLNASGERVSVWVRWPQSHRGANVTLTLYRFQRGSATPVGRSQRYRHDSTPNAWLSRRTEPGGSYYVEIHGPPALEGAHLELVSPTHRLQYINQSGSIVAPATARRVLTVGAYDPRAQKLEPFSSVGPIDGGRPGIDVVAPSGFAPSPRGERFRGTSAAAAYTAGVVALVLDANPRLSPKQVEAVVEASATDAASRGIDPVTGSGRVAPVAAVRRARNLTAS